MTSVDHFLISAVACGAVIIGLFGFHRGALHGVFFIHDATESWHRGAILWSIGFCYLWQVKIIIILRNQPPVWALITWVIIVVASIILLVTFLVNPQVDPLILALPYAVVFGILNVLLWYAVDTSGVESHHTRQHGRRAELSFLLSDIPAVVAFVFLLLLGTVAEMPPDVRRVFVSGAICFQLLSSKAIFILIESGVFDSESMSRPDAPQPGTSAMAAG